LCACLWWFLNGLPVSEADAAQVRDGMGRDKVRPLLGMPRTVIAESDGSECWIYHRHSLTAFVIQFSARGEVTSSGFDEGGGLW
jgi:hypothetical protein